MCFHVSLHVLSLGLNVHSDVQTACSIKLIVGSSDGCVWPFHQLMTDNDCSRTPPPPQHKGEEDGQDGQVWETGEGGRSYV